MIFNLIKKKESVNIWSSVGHEIENPPKKVYKSKELEKSIYTPSKKVYKSKEL